MGVTTVTDRRDTLLTRTLHSLCDAGFDVGRLFVDGTDDASPYAVYGIEVTVRQPRLGVHGAWVLAIYELFLRQPRADVYAVFQDDLVCCLNLREYLQRNPWPDDGWANLSTPAFETNRVKRKRGWFVSKQRGHGAVGLLFSHEAARRLLSHEHMLNRTFDKEHEHKYPNFVDGGIVETLNRCGMKEYCHYPALIQHTGGNASTIRSKWHGKDATPSFVGEGFDAITLL